MRKYKVPLQFLIKDWGLTEEEASEIVGFDIVTGEKFKPGPEIMLRAVTILRIHTMLRLLDSEKKSLMKGFFRNSLVYVPSDTGVTSVYPLDYVQKNGVKGLQAVFNSLHHQINQQSINP